MSAPENNPREVGELGQLLSAAWQAHSAPAATPQLDASDLQTQASVNWMRSAWLEVSESPVNVPANLRRRLSTRRAPVLAWRRHVAAAALLISVGIALHFGGAGSIRAPGLEIPQAQRDPPAAKPRLVAARGDHLEFRSGLVRLLLLTSNESPPLNQNPSSGSDFR